MVNRRKTGTFDTWETVYILGTFTWQELYRLGNRKDTFTGDPPSFWNYNDLASRATSSIFVWIRLWDRRLASRKKNRTIKPSCMYMDCIWISWIFQRRERFPICTRDLFLGDGENTQAEFDRPNGGSLSDNVETRARILSKRSRKTSLED